jgi:hypothetical protein
MRFLSIITLASSAMSMAIAPRGDEPNAPAVSAVTHSGNGCPQDSVVESSNGGRTFKIYDFAAKAPGGDTTQNCALHFTVAGVAGWQVSVKHVSVRGYAQIPVGSAINFFFTNFWSASPEDTVRETLSFRPGAILTRKQQSTVSSQWKNEDESGVSSQVVLELDVPPANRAWSPCGKGGILNPNFRAVIQDSGFFGTRGSVVTTETLSYEWREC